MSAFHHDAAIKTKILAELDAGTVPDNDASAETLSVWADGAGLPPALVLLATYLTRGEDESGQRFLRTLLEPAEPGANLIPVAHSWVVWAWENAPAPLCVASDDPRYRDAGEAMVSLHRRVAAGDTVESGVWRSVRGALNRLANGNDVMADAASVLAAGSWDFATVPGAAHDMANAWDKAEMSRINREQNWTDADRGRIQEIIIEQRGIAEERLGKDAERSALTTAMVAQLDTLNDPHLFRNRDVRDLVLAAFEQLRKASSAALIELVHATTQVEA
ncbi:hypothetical protein [Sphingomonas sp.]|uniref:hypothetical protein n=1 Tax=Sphingomonas sp. TaxID=28214 RepID=UPI003D6CC931